MSLIEVIIVIVIVGTSAAFVVAALVSAARAIQRDEIIQIATRTAQQCAAHLVMSRRQQGVAGIGYSTLSTVVCPVAWLPTGYTFTPAVSFTNVSASAPCNLISGATCTRVTVSVQHTASTYTAVLNYLAVNY